MKKVFFLAVLSIFLFSATKSQADILESWDRFGEHGGLLGMCSEFFEGNSYFKELLTEFETIVVPSVKKMKKDPLKKTLAKSFEKGLDKASEEFSKLNGKIEKKMRCGALFYYAWGVIDGNILFKE